MANVKISQLPSLTSLSGTDVLPVVSGNVTYNVTAANIAALATGGNTGNVTFDNNIILGTGDEFGGDGLYLAPGPGSIANSAVQYLRVRGGDYPTHIHLDTGNNEFYDQYFGADDKFVKLEANGNVLINASNLANNSSATWTFDDTGNLNTPQGGYIGAAGVKGDGTMLTGGTGNIASLTSFYADAPGIYAGCFTANPDGTVNISTYGNGTGLNGQWTFSEANLTLPGNTFAVNYANGTPVSLGGGAVDTISNGTSNVTIPTANANVDINVGEAVSTFDSTGNLVLSNNFVIGAPFGVAQISAPNGLTLSTKNEEPLSLQAFDNDNNVNSSLTLDPNNTLTRLDGFSSQDSNSWTTADWATGVYTTQGGGTIGAVEFTGATTIIDYINALPNPEYVFIQVNNGPLLPFAGSSGGATNITFYTNDLPATDPTTVTDFAYYYSLNSFIEMDYDSQELNIEGNGLDLTISTRDNSDIEISSIRNLNVNGNGSYSIRNFSSNDPIQIQTDSNGGAQTWSFGANGILSLPGEGVLQSTDDQVTLRSFDSGSGEANLVYLGTSGGLGFQDTSAGGNWLEIFRSGANPQIGTPGNLLITADSTNTAPTWTYDNTGNLTLPGNTSAVNYANGTSILDVNSISNGNSNVSIATADGPITMYGNGVIVANVNVNNLSIGSQAGNAGQSSNAIAIGTLAGAISQGVDTIAIGQQAGNNNQNANSVAIGAFAGTGFQAGNSVAVGTSAGSFNQGISATSVGGYAGTYNQANGAVALGGSAGFSNQGINAVAIGLQAGNAFQGNSSIAIGTGAATANQGLQSIALGVGAGDNAQGNNAIAIGAFAGNATQPANSIMLNASGTALNGTNAGFYVNPVRANSLSVSNAVFYNTGSNELTYSATKASTIAGSNTAVTLDNIEARVGGAPIRLYINTVTGNLTGAGDSQTMTSGSTATASWINVPIGAGAANAFAMSGAISQNGDTVVLNLIDQGTSTGMWRITGMIANTTANTYGVSIERLF